MNLDLSALKIFCNIFHDELAAGDLDDLRRKLLSSRTGRAHKILQVELITAWIHLACFGKGYSVSLCLRDAAGGVT